jgi:PAS domain S-box-containing protein
MRAAATPLRVLLVEDNAADARLVKEALREAGARAEIDWQARLAGGLERLAADVRRGAQDYLLKEHTDPHLLARTLAYAVERAQSARTLRESESRLRALGENLPHGALYQVVITADGQRRFAYMSASIEKVFGVTAGEVMADAPGFYALIVEADLPRVQAAELESLRTMSVFDCEFRQRSRQGDVRWIRCRSAPRRLADGSTIWDGVVVDETTRRQAVEALRESEERYRFLVEQSSGLICTHDDAGNLTSINPAAAAILGYSREELIGRSIAQLLHPKVKGLFSEYLARILSNGEDDGVMRVVTATGQERFFHYHNRLLHPGSGSAYVLGVGGDITERMRSEAELAYHAHHDALTGLPRDGTPPLAAPTSSCSISTCRAPMGARPSPRSRTIPSCGASR